MKVIRSLSLGLDEKAIDAVRQWRSKPTMKEGKPVTPVAQVEVSFRLL
jgi:periplasmic protein TonB